MDPVKDETGNRYGKLVVVSRTTNDKYGRASWLCRCDCGGQVETTGKNLRRGHTKSCGCLLGDRNRERTKHGGAPRSGLTATYNSWRAMRERCENPKSIAFRNYGGRGIRVDPIWGEFENFLRDMGERPQGYTLDRIDVNLGYCKQNCRWSTRAEQNRNKRTTVWVVHNFCMVRLADVVRGKTNRSRWYDLGRPVCVDALFEES